MNGHDLIFLPIKIYCLRCGMRIPVSFEELSDNEEVVCPECSFVFLPNVDVDKFLRLMNQAEQAINDSSRPPIDRDQP